jgi:hypothetical protein
MKVDWKSCERATKALEALISIKRDKQWKRI